MKATLVAIGIALIASLSVPAVAANDHGAMHGTSSAASNQMSDAVVKAIDKTGKLTLSHGPLPNGMPAMTMAFRVSDLGWLDQLKAGDKVRFMANQINGGMTVTHLERN